MARYRSSSRSSSATPDSPYSGSLQTKPIRRTLWPRDMCATRTKNLGASRRQSLLVMISGWSGSPEGDGNSDGDLFIGD